MIEKRSILKIVLLGALSGTLTTMTGCGLKGPLYLPAPEATAPQTTTPQGAQPPSLPQTAP